MCETAQKLFFKKCLPDKISLHIEVVDYHTHDNDFACHLYTLLNTVSIHSTVPNHRYPILLFK